MVGGHDRRFDVHRARSVPRLLVPILVRRYRRSWAGSSTAASSSLPPTSSLRHTDARWLSTVLAEMNRRSEISRLDAPADASRATSSSRAVTMSGRFDRASVFGTSRRRSHAIDRQAATPARSPVSAVAAWAAAAAARSAIVSMRRAPWSPRRMPDVGGWVPRRIDPPMPPETKPRGTQDHNVRRGCDRNRCAVSFRPTQTNIGSQIGHVQPTPATRTSDRSMADRWRSVPSCV